MTTRSPHSFPLLRHFWWPTCCRSRALSLRLSHLRWPTCHLDGGPTVRSPSYLSLIAELRPHLVLLSSSPHFIHVDGAPSFPDSFLRYAKENSVYVLGGEVAVGEKQKYGKMEISVEEDYGLHRLEAVCRTQVVWMTMVTRW